MSTYESVTIKVRDGQTVAEPMGDAPLSESTKRVVADLLRERTPEEKALSARLYNETCERLWGKFLARRDELTIPANKGWGAFRTANPLAQQLVYEVDAEFNYEMSWLQCDWCVAMFLDYSPTQYEAETGVRIEARS